VDPRTKAQKTDTSESEVVLPYNCFQIMVGGQVVYLTAQTRDEMKEWIAKINKAAQGTF